MGNSNVEVGLEYWWRWQVPVCALIIAIPATISSILIKRKLKSGHHLSNGCLWVPCWRGMNPNWLLLYRIFALTSMASILYQMVSSIGFFAFYFYTQWTFTLVMVYFAIATIISARGCWMNLEKAPTEEADEQAGFWGHLMHIVYQVSGGASVLTDLVFWCVLVPMLSGKEFRLTLLIGLIHSVNVVFLFIDSSLNNLPFQWSGFPYFALWTVLYISFQWIVHACGFTRWPYPFLELATPWAPLWYLGIALFHFPCHGLYITITKGMVSSFSRLFPKAHMRLNEGMLQREKTT